VRGGEPRATTRACLARTMVNRSGRSGPIRQSSERAEPTGAQAAGNRRRRPVRQTGEAEGGCQAVRRERAPDRTRGDTLVARDAECDACAQAYQDASTRGETNAGEDRTGTQILRCESVERRERARAGSRRQPIVS
jgi:hypothetical protein